MLASRNLHAGSEGAIASILVREKVLIESVGAHFATMYGFRNRLVHAYGTLDDEKVADYVDKHLSYIDELLTVFKGFL